MIGHYLKYCMDSDSQDLYSLEKREETTNIIISYISLQLTTLTEVNFDTVEERINHLLDSSSESLVIKYWERLILLCSSGIKSNYNKLSPDLNLYHRLLLHLIQELPYKSQDFIVLLIKNIFKDNHLTKQTKLLFEDYCELLSNHNLDPLIIDPLEKHSILQTKLNTNTMNNSTLLSHLIKQSNLDNIESNLTDVLASLSGESLNDMVALLLSEILSPGSQNLQKDENNNPQLISWFTSQNISDSIKIGVKISNSLHKISSEGLINWNRVFNLISTKYFMNIPIKATLVSLNSLFSILRTADLIDQFFSCDWNISFKLLLSCLLHQWKVDEHDTDFGYFNLLNVPNIKKVSKTLKNTQNSLLYLMSISVLDLEIFLLRDELKENSMLPMFQEYFFQDFSLVPEYLYLAMTQNLKHFGFLVENRNIIDEIIVTLFVQIYQKHFNDNEYPLNDMVSFLPNRDKLLIDIGTKLLLNKDIQINHFFSIITKLDKLDYFVTHVPFNVIFKYLPQLIYSGWKGFESFMKINLNVNNVSVVLDKLESQVNEGSNSNFNVANNFDLGSLKFLITLLMDMPLSNDQLERYENLQYNIIITFPKIIYIEFGNEDFKNSEQFVPFAPEIEEEMQSYLQKMYSGEISIKDVVDVLRRLKESNVKKDKDVFACITHAILAECVFFKDYPLEALATTSVLFGSMVLFNIFSGFILDVALHKILVFAKEGPESKMFKFAIQAIYAFRMRLTDFPQYCKDILKEVPGLQTQTQVYQFIYDAAQVSEKANSSKQGKTITPVELIPQEYFFVGEWNAPVSQETPPKAITEKVLFIVNNLTMDNFNDKITDLKESLQPNYYAWFANYLVNQRAKTEPNYHELYVKIVTAIGSTAFHECILITTLRQLYVFIGAKDIQKVDKKILKNLSQWLGIITLGCNKPIRYKNVAFRELLLQAYKENRLDIVVPFVTKILESATTSKVFKLPNPWTLGILKLLLELNKKANWKLSLTFEVEVLFKAFKLSMKEIEPTNFIEVPDIVETLSGSLNAMTIEQQQIERQKQGLLMQQYQQQILIHQQRQQQMMPMVNDQQPGFLSETITYSNEAPFSNLSGSSIFVTHPELKCIFQIALAKSVREILVPVVEKSSNIAVVTTSKIVVKDFATEVDEMKLTVAALTMVRQLAVSLARATSTEPLKDAIRTTTQSLIPNLVTLPGSPLEELDFAINDNISLALNLIEEAARERASQEINESLLQAIAIRRYHQERRADQPFLDPNGNFYSLSLPEPLGLRNTGVTQQQFRIYEEFGSMIPTTDSNDMSTQNIALSKQKMQQTMLPQDQQPSTNQLQRDVPNMVSQQSVQQQQQPTVQNPQVQPVIQNELEQNHRVLVHLMDVLVAQIKENADKPKLNDLGEQNQIKNIIFQILTFIARSPQKDQLALKVAQAVVNSLFATSESSLCREVLSLLLEKLCSLSLVARKDVVWWLIYALDTRKFDVPVIRALLEVKLIDPAELDTVLVTAMEKKMDKSVDFAINLLKDVVLSDNPLLMKMDFVRTLEYLGLSDDHKVKKFLKTFEKEKVLPVHDSTEISTTEKYFLVFTDWVKLLQRVDYDDKIVMVFLRQMVDKGILSDTDGLIKFIKAALELSVYSFKESDPTSDVFTAIDALSKLIIKLLIIQDFSGYSRKEYLNTIGSIILLVFSKDHERKDSDFNERPYFRLISNLFYEWSKIRGHNFAKITDVKIRRELRKFDNDFYNCFASFLHSMQPFAFFGFTFAWVSLISHRMFLPMILSLPDKIGWEKFMLLIIDLFKFLDKYTKKNSVSDAISVVYKGTLRIILGISNDFPNFLIENHYELMNNIPCTYFQLRNVILSAIPLKTMVPNPYDSELKLEELDMCSDRPEVYYNPINDILSIKKPVDNYLRIPSNSLLRTIMNAMYRTEYDVQNGVGYDFLSVDKKAIRALVLYVGIEAGLENERTSSSAIFNRESSYYALLFNMLNDGTTELRYQVLQVMLEQLRYPNIHTHWFIYMLLNMFNSKSFGESLLEIQEIMLRCILERIIVNKPHPWGITVMFCQLIRQQGNKLLELPFIQAIPEIEKIFQVLLKYTISKPEVELVDDPKNTEVVSAASK